MSHQAADENQFISLATIPLSKPFTFLAKLYLLGYAIYVALLFNVRLDKELDWLGLGLVLLGLFCIRSQQIASLWQTLTLNPAMKLFSISLAGLVLVLSIATFRQLPQTQGLLSLGAQCWMPLTLSIVTALILMSIKNPAMILLAIFSLGAATIAGFDIALYYQQLSSASPMGVGNRHRDLTDAYIFFLPFIWACAIFAKSKLSRVILWMLIILISVLSVGSGSRGVYIVLPFELLILMLILFFFGFFKKRLISFTNLMSILVILGLALWSAVLWLSPVLFNSALSRGLLVDERMLHTWKPTIFFISNAPWFGYGLGVSVWNTTYAAYQQQLADTINFGGAHNWILQLGFVGGLPAIILMLLLTAALFWQLKLICSNVHIKLWLKKLALVIGLSFFAFYIVRGLVETPNSKPFYLLITCFLYLAWQYQAALNHQASVHKGL